VGDSLVSIDFFIRRIGVGAMLILAFSSWRSTAGRDARIASLFAGVSLAAWMATEADRLWAAFGNSMWLLVPAYPVGGAFWLFIAIVFADRRVTAATLAPAALLFVTGALMTFAPPPIGQALWALRNLAGALLSAHAVYMIVRNWQGDLVEGRRRLRASILATGALFGVAEVVVAFASRLDPDGPWRLLDVGEPYGGAFVTLLAVTTTTLFVQARSEVFGAPRRIEPAVDGRAEAADRLLLTKLNAFMAAESWRREGLTIGELARQLAEPEHRLRRLINHRLGHRNFADFVNGHRIEAAKARLADPSEARTTVAAIAFDLGYGSLGPFNRAFRAATGATPTQWRRRALSPSPNLQEAG
jgi:AraC-like DNA-binding protein